MFNKNLNSGYDSGASAISINYLKDDVPSTLAHEMGHAINYKRRINVPGELYKSGILSRLAEENTASSRGISAIKKLVDEGKVDPSTLEEARKRLETSYNTYTTGSIRDLADTYNMGFGRTRKKLKPKPSPNEINNTIKKEETNIRFEQNKSNNKDKILTALGIGIPVAAATGLVANEVIQADKERKAKDKEGEEGDNKSSEKKGK